VNPFAPILAARGHVLLDGGLATALEQRGHDLGTRLWSARLLLDEPDEVAAVHRAYLSAGADCITTASYQASVPGFVAAGLAVAQAQTALRRSSELALAARAEVAGPLRTGPLSPGPSPRGTAVSDPAGRTIPRRLVAASVGPYGAYLADGSEYHGRYGVGVEVLDDFHRPRFQLLASTDVDVLACETIPSVEEAEVLLGVLDETPGIWAWMSFSCRDATAISDGTPFSEVVQRCARHERVAAVGVNCTAPRHVPALIASARSVTDLPLIAYPNSGEVYDARSKTWGEDPGGAESWLATMGDVRAAGATITGGCCRIGPELIAQLRMDITGGD
jgi:homocysteine S-methyltransferase